MDRARSPMRPALWALALLIGLSWASTADAQLFPNAPTRKRERTPREAEPPMYSQVRQQYWGYYPTCWRRFPEGWCCPNSEKADIARSFKELPLQPPDSAGGEEGLDSGTDTGEEEGAGAGNEGAQGEEGMEPPPLPDRRSSPFEQSPDNNGNGNRRRDDPFETPSQSGLAPNAPPAAMMAPAAPARPIPPVGFAPNPLPVPARAPAPGTLGAQAIARPEQIPARMELPPTLSLDPEAAIHVSDVNYPRPAGLADGSMRPDSAPRPIEMGTPSYSEEGMAGSTAPVDNGPRRKPFSTLFARFRRGS